MAERESTKVMKLNRAQREVLSIVAKHGLVSTTTYTYDGLRCSHVHGTCAAGLVRRGLLRYVFEDRSLLMSPKVEITAAGREALEGET